ncbi:unnamed protein product [Penicillium salamii]|uniref:Major facilitator superfamily (MFS) profile domain-containing protein n=1 Tax=Penicillium salamii TaxID=1612424 RepID=A0A9W4NY49_9EURO|nr:unnamed protein product [Penicillium salamii]
MDIMGPASDSGQSAHAERKEVDLLVTFDPEASPVCSYSLSLARKWLIVIIICTATVCVTCTSSIYTTTYVQMDAEFNTSRLVSTIGLSVFVLGISMGPLLTSPLSEWFGRKPIYLVAWSLFIVWNIPPAVARNIQTIIIARFFTGFTGGTFLAVAGGTVRDLFSDHSIQKPMALVSAAPFIGPCFGPLIGGFINFNTHWRWTYYFVIIWSVVLLVLISVLTPETYHPAKLQSAARKLRKKTGNNRYQAAVNHGNQTKGRMLLISLLRPFQLLFLEPMCLCLSLYSALLLGILYLFFGAFPLVFQTQYGMNLWQIGLTFLGIIIGMIAAALSTPVWIKVRAHLLNKSKDGVEVRCPEYRLPPAILGGFLTPIGLFWFGWTTRPDVHWIVPILGSGKFVDFHGDIHISGKSIFFSCNFSLLDFKARAVSTDTINSKQVDAYPQYAASALAANGFARSSFAAAFPLFGIQLYQGLGYQWATSLLAFLTVAMMPFPCIFFVYGKAIRGKSRFATTG